MKAQAKIGREESEHVVRMLVERYPKTFFDNPRLRKPLKANIAADLKSDGFPAADELIMSGVEWYQSHLGYYMAVAAGVKKLDLQGNDVGTVTEAEARAAKERVADIHETMKEKRNATQTLNQLYVDGKISDDMLKKLDAPAVARAKAINVPPEWARLRSAIKSAAVSYTNTPDPALRAALVGAALGLAITEAQRIVSSLAAE